MHEVLVVFFSTNKEGIVITMGKNQSILGISLCVCIYYLSLVAFYIYTFV